VVFIAIKKNEILSFSGKWMKLDNIIFCEVSQAQKNKNRISSSYLDYGPKTNAVILLDIDHTLRGGIGKGKKTKNLNMVDMLTV
jgi:hypothetical protein